MPIITGTIEAKMLKACIQALGPSSASQSGGSSITDTLTRRLPGPPAVLSFVPDYLLEYFYKYIVPLGLSLPHDDAALNATLPSITKRGSGILLRSQEYTGLYCNVIEYHARHRGPLVPSANPGSAIQAGTTRTKN